MLKHYKNFIYFFLALFVFVLLGFYKPYFSEFPHFDKSITTLIHIHADALILWVVLLVVQPFLIRFRKIRLHRLFGKFTWFLVPVIIVTSILVIIKQYNEGIEQKMSAAKSLKTLLIPFTEILFFSVFYVLAIIYRRKVALHMRYIICNALVLITPSLARILGYWFYMRQLYSYQISFVLTDSILVALVVYDVRKGLNYRPYLVALTLFLIFDVSWFLSGYPF